MKDIIKTLVLVLIIIIGGYIGLVAGDSLKKTVVTITRNNLSKDDPIIQELYPKIENNILLRRSNLIPSNLTSEEIIKYTLDSISGGDYKTKTYKAQKITCNITNGITFVTSTGKCKVAIINNSVFSKYQKNDFNTDIEIDFIDLNYHGLNCKNDGSKYYCQILDFTNTQLGYSLFSDAYEDKNSIVIHEYYLSIDLTDNERCKKYLSSDYCDNYQGKDRPNIEEDVIKNNGVLYEHIFTKDNDKYYLERSYILSNR